jgi:uncharacterized protein (DUF1015 family)
VFDAFHDFDYADLFTGTEEYVLRIKPFQALRPPGELAAVVSCPPYDVVSLEEARRVIDKVEHSFMRVIRPEAADSSITDPHSRRAYRASAANLRKMISAGYLVRDMRAGLYVYRQRMGDHTQTGLVACCHVDDYNSGIIKKHERTREDKETDRTRHIEALKANSGPVFLTYRDDEAVSGLVSDSLDQEPICDFIAPDGVAHTVWRAGEPEKVVRAMEGVPACYIADGHHRAAAAARYAAERRKGGGESTESDWFTAVMFPASNLKVLPYNRCLTSLGDLSADQFIKEVKKEFRLAPCSDPHTDRRSGMKMYAGGRWYELLSGEEETKGTVSSLDASVLQQKILGPVLNVTDPRTDGRLLFIGGANSIEKVTEAVDSGRAEVAFSLHPVRIEDIMAVSDAGEIMPPKSTWFEPKLRSGLFVHTFD